MPIRYLGRDVKWAAEYKSGVPGWIFDSSMQIAFKSMNPDENTLRIGVDKGVRDSTLRHCIGWRGKDEAAKPDQK